MDAIKRKLQKNAARKRYHEKNKNNPIYIEKCREAKRKQWLKNKNDPVYQAKQKERHKRHYERKKSDPSFVLINQAWAKNKRRNLENYKIKVGCQNSDCGWKKGFLPCQLEFHHLDRSEKKFSISYNVVRKSLDELKKEIAKCSLLCACCHRLVECGEVNGAELPKCPEYTET